jgi:WD40 repeat protein
MRTNCVCRPRSDSVSTAPFNPHHPRPRPARIGHPTARPCLLVAITVFLAVFCTQGATVQFDWHSSGPLEVAESAGMALVPLSRTGDTPGALTVGYEVVAGSATEGLDFTGGAGVVVFGAGQLRQVISVPILRDALREEPETLVVRLTDISGEETLQGPDELTIQIEDDDPGPHFGQHFYRLWERTGRLTVHVFRGDDGETPRTLSYRTEDVTARAGIDYEAANGELTFTPGQRFLPVTLHLAADDEDIEPIKTFRLLLHEPGDLATPLAVATVQIDDDDTSVISVEEYHSPHAPTNVVRVPVWREHALHQVVNVSFETVALPDSLDAARPGIDYTPVSGRLQFAPGEVERHLEIPVLDHARDSWDSRQVRLRLSDPSPGAETGRHEVQVTLSFGPSETPPQGLPPDRVYGYPDRLSETMTPDGKYLAVGTHEGTFIWHLPTGRFLKQLATGHTTMLALSPDGSLLATSDGRWILVWEVDQQRLRQRLEGVPQSFSFSPDGSQLAVTTREERLQVFATDSVVPRRSLPDRQIGGGGPRVQLVSPSGRWTIRGDREHVSVWDTRTGGVVLALPGGHEAALAVSPDETHLLIAAEGRATLWNLETQVKLEETDGVHLGALAAGAYRLALVQPGKLEVRTLGGLTLWQTNLVTADMEVRDVALSPDGKHLAASIFLRTQTPNKSLLLLRNLETSATIMRLEDHVGGLRFSPDSRTLLINGVTGGGLGGGQSWFLAAYQTASQSLQWQDMVNGYVSGTATFAPDSFHLIQPTFQGILVRRTSDGTTVAQWPTRQREAPVGIGWDSARMTEVYWDVQVVREPVLPHAVVAESHWAAGLGSSYAGRNGYHGPSNEFVWRQFEWGAVVVLDANSLDVVERFSEALRPVALGGDTFAIAEAAGSVLTMFNRASRQRLRSFELGGILQQAALSPDDQLLFLHQIPHWEGKVGTTPARVRVLDALTGVERWHRPEISLTGQLPLVATTHPQRFVYSPRGSGLIHLQDMRDSEPLATVGGHGTLSGLFLPPGGGHALTYLRTSLRQYNFGYHLALWNLEAGQIIRFIEGREPQINTQGTRLLVRNIDSFNPWRLEDLATGALIQTWRSNEAESYAVLRLSPDGQYVAATGWVEGQPALWLWQAETGELIWRMNADQLHSSSLQFSPDSQSLLVMNQTVGWALLPISGEALRQFGPGASARFSPDSSRLLTLSSPATLWDARSGEAVASFGSSWPWLVEGANFSPDGRTLYMFVNQGNHSLPNNLLVIDAVTGELIAERPFDDYYSSVVPLMDEDALLVSGFSGTWLLDSSGRQLARLTPAGSATRTPMHSSQVALSVGYGRFGIWDLSHVFKHRLRTLASPGGLQLDWREGTLQRAPEVSGPWADLPAARPPWAIPPQGERSFFRVKGQ